MGSTAGLASWETLSLKWADWDGWSPYPLYDRQGHWCQRGTPCAPSLSLGHWWRRILGLLSAHSAVLSSPTACRNEAWSVPCPGGAAWIGSLCLLSGFLGASQPLLEKGLSLSRGFGSRLLMGHSCWVGNYQGSSLRGSVCSRGLQSVKRNMLFLNKSTAIL